MASGAAVAITASPLDAVSSSGDVDDSIPHTRGGNIGQVANVVFAGGGQDRRVEIRIGVDAARPPAGRVQPPDGPAAANRRVQQEIGTAIGPSE
jgi:hypothetical protein